jgi:hypothetical protein
MALTREEQHLIKVGLQALHAKDDFKKKIGKELQADSKRRRRIAEKFRNGLLMAAFKAAGIDPKEIKKRQDRENRSLRARLKKLMPEVNKNARVVAERQKNMVPVINGFAKSLKVPRHRGPSPPNPETPPPLGTLLTEASNASVSEDSGLGTVASVGPYKNILRTTLSFLESGQGVSAAECDFSFIYTPERSGVLHGWAWATSNGSCGWATEQTCWGGAYVAGSATVSMTLQQMGATGILNQVSVPGQDLGNFNIGFQQDEHCNGDSGTVIFDEDASLESTMDLPVVGGVPVQIVVSIGASVQGSNAFADLDLSTNGRNLNVLGVALILY